MSVTSYVGFRTSTQPTNIKQLAKYDFSKRNPTNHVAGVFVQALSILNKIIVIMKNCQVSSFLM
ncbi:MAG: hypothetical protein K8R28_05715, partial [Desulfobacterales bacterium]|nr:hypothetical protein [Desulfobacterales bacterium]